MASNFPAHVWLSFADISVFNLNLYAPHSVVFGRQKPWASERPCYLVTTFYSQPELAGTASSLNYIPNPNVKVFPGRCAIIALSLVFFHAGQESLLSVAISYWPVSLTGNILFFT